MLVISKNKFIHYVILCFFIFNFIMSILNPRFCFVFGGCPLVLDLIDNHVNAYFYVSGKLYTSIFHLSLVMFLPKHYTQSSSRNVLFVFNFTCKFFLKYQLKLKQQAAPVRQNMLECLLNRGRGTRVPSKLFFTLIFLKIYKSVPIKIKNYEGVSPKFTRCPPKSLNLFQLVKIFIPVQFVSKHWSSY